MKMKIVKKSDFYHVYKMRTDFKVNDLPIVAPKMSKEVSFLWLRHTLTVGT